MGNQTIVRGLRNVKIAAWNAENDYGTAYNILGAREFSVEFVVETDELRGDDVVLDRFSKIVSVSARVEYAAVDLQALEILSGGTFTSVAGYEDLMIGAEDLTNYFAIAGKVVGSQSRDVHMFVPKARVSGNFGYQAQLDQYLLPSLDIEGVKEGTINGFGRIRNFSLATTLAIPLSTTSGS